MTLKELAEKRMITGKANHPDQNWDDLTHEQLMAEAREELADLYNYFSKAPAKIKTFAYSHLDSLWVLAKTDDPIPSKTFDFIDSQINPERNKHHCLFDNLPEDMKGKPMALSCSCPKCSPQC